MENSTSKGKEKSTNSNDNCMMTLEELKKIPIKKRKPGETKRYNQLMYNKRKIKIAEEKNENIKIKEAETEEKEKQEESPTKKNMSI